MSSADPPRALVQLRGVSYRYGSGPPVLDGVDADFAAGLTLVVGPNGAGKSTLLRLVAGVERPSKGTIRLAGHDLWRAEVAARRGLVYLPEQPDLSPYASLEETLAMVCRVRGIALSRVDEVLAATQLAAHRHRSVRQLSMGQRRRGLLAAAWIGWPEIAVLDEPLEAMDREGRQQIVRWVTELRQDRVAVLLATHDFEPFVAVADEVVAVGRNGLLRHRLDGLDEDQRMVRVEQLAGRPRQAAEGASASAASPSPGWRPSGTR